MKADIALTIRQEWTHIANIRYFIEKLVLIETGNPEHAHALSFSSSELLENAVKFSDGGDISLRINFRAGDAAEIEVKNRSTPGHIGDLEKELEQIAALDPESVYEYKLNPGDASTSMENRLGLAMIRGKTRCDYRLQVTGNDVVLTCTIPLPAREPVHG